MTGHRTIASVACSCAVVVLGMTPAHAADATRTRSASSNAAQATSSTAPQSLTQYMELISDGGAFTGGPALLGELTPPAVPRKSLSGGGKNGGGDCAREPFPCGVYTDEAQFDAEQGPFSRALGNYEDQDLINVNNGNYCGITAPPADCLQHSGVNACAGGLSLNAGDILTGLNINVNASRGFSIDVVEFGTGFNGNTSRLIMANYFGDEFHHTFPTAGSCPKAGPVNVWGARIVSPFSSPGAIITLTLGNGDSFEWNMQAQGQGTMDFEPGVFVGFCCSEDIVDVSMVAIDGLVVGADNIKWGVNPNPCPVSFPPLTLEDINCAIEQIEAKLDAGIGGGSGGGCDFCEPELDLVVNAGAEARLRHRRDLACKAEVTGKYESAQHHRCQMDAEIDSLLASGGLDATEAAALEACLDAEQTNRSDDPCN